MRTGLRLGLAAAALALLAGGCAGGGGGSGGVETKAVTPVPTEAPPPAGAATEAPVFEPPELIVSIDEAPQGSAILVSVTGSVTEGEVVFLGRSHPLTQGDRSKYTYVGVGVFDPPGTHTMQVRLTLANGSAGSFAHEVTVLETEWDVTSIIYHEREGGGSLLSNDERDREAALLAETYALETPEKLWEGRWRSPVEGGVSSQFGERRAFNDGPVTAQHGGTDFGAPEGTPVTASNSGRVALARQLAVRGNIVIIDHGGGVLSSYSHLSAFAVAEGQAVEKGQLIAFVGDTGLSTAPHLHWEISVHGVLVDPLRFLDGRNGF